MHWETEVQGTTGAVMTTAVGSRMISGIAGRSDHARIGNAMVCRDADRHLRAHRQQQDQRQYAGRTSSPRPGEKHSERGDNRSPPWTMRIQAGSFVPFRATPAGPGELFISLHPSGCGPHISKRKLQRHLHQPWRSCFHHLAEQRVVDIAVHSRRAEELSVIKSIKRLQSELQRPGF